MIYKTSKKQEALSLAEELLGDIELKRLEPIDFARKASRLARLTNDEEAIIWLYYEVSGYPIKEAGLDQRAWKAAKRSNRTYYIKNDEKANVSSLGELQARIDAAKTQLLAAVDAPHSISSANPNQYVQNPTGNIMERNRLNSDIVANKSLLDKIVGSLHTYATRKYTELRFGAAVESAFDNIRSNVDANITSIVPSATPILTTALENAGSNNPIQWSNAAKACRDLIIALADALRPPGNPVDKRLMDAGHYKNRLVEWIEKNTSSESKANLIKSDLDYLGNRLDAVTEGGNKGAHANVTKTEASRYIVGTYIFLGDVLELHGQNDEVKHTTKLKTMGTDAVSKAEENTSSERPKNNLKKRKPTKKQQIKHA